MLKSGIIPDAFLRLMGADPFSLDGAVALGAVHPIAIALEIVYPVGFAAAAIAGERQRGTLEVLLSRPRVPARRSTSRSWSPIVGAAIVTAVGMTAGTVAGAALYGVAGGLDAGELAILLLNTVLLLAALGGISLAASASFDRLTPAIGIALAVTLFGYVLEILGTLWPDAAFLQPYSLFHYLRPLEILGGEASAGRPPGAGRRARRQHGLWAVAVPSAGPRRADLSAVESRAMTHPDRIRIGLNLPTWPLRDGTYARGRRCAVSPGTWRRSASTPCGCRTISSEPAGPPAVRVLGVLDDPDGRRRGHVADRDRPVRRLHGLPQPGAPGADGGHARRGQRRPRGAGHGQRRAGRGTSPGARSASRRSGTSGGSRSRSRSPRASCGSPRSPSRAPTCAPTAP